MEASRCRSLHDEPALGVLDVAVVEVGCQSGEPSMAVPAMTLGGRVDRYRRQAVQQQVRAIAGIPMSRSVSQSVSQWATDKTPLTCGSGTVCGCGSRVKRADLPVFCPVREPHPQTVPEPQVN